MVRLVRLAAVLAAVVAAGPASALGVCDGDGHFCMQVDTTNAGVCDLMGKGELDPATCTAEDAELRDGMSRVGMLPVRALRVRFEDWQVYVTVVKHPAAGELAQEDLEGHAAQVRGAMERASGKIDVFAPPVISRMRGVEIVRFDRQWVDGEDRLREVDLEVFSRDALYMVSFQGIAGPHLVPFADRAIETLDALPVVASVRSGAAVTWGVRALIVAAVVALALRFRANLARGARRP